MRDRATNHRVSRTMALFFCALLPVAAWAADLRVADAWIRLLPSGAPAGGYFVLHNDSRRAASLTGVTSAAFGHVMIHKTIEARGVSQMVHLERVEIPAGGKLAFAPGGYHLMLMQPTRKLAPGERIPVMLEFLGGRQITAEFQVYGPAGK